MRVLRDVAVTACMFILMYSATGYLYKKIDIEKSTLTWLFVLLYSALLGLYFFLLHKKVTFIGIFISLLSVMALSLVFLYEGVFMIISPLAVLVAVIGVNKYTSNSER